MKASKGNNAAIKIMKNALLLLILFAMPAYAYERLQGPTELLYHDKAKAFGGYTLFGVGGRTYLLDIGRPGGSHMADRNKPALVG